MIIGLCHRARVGKDTAGEYLLNHWNNSGVALHAFAEPLKEEVDTMLRAIGGHYSEDDKELLRPLLRAWGEYRRQQDPDYWIKPMRHRIGLFGGFGLHVITDVRYPNEADTIRKWGGIIVRINRDTGLDIPSEAIMDDYVADYEVDNNGTLEELFGQLDKIIEAQRG